MIRCRNALVTLFVPWSAAAVVCGPSQLGDLRRPGLRALSVNLVGEAERKNATDFGAAQTPKMTARQVEQRYAATGTITCLGPDGNSTEEGSAQVTVANNVITTAGHINMLGGDCSKKASPPKCFFSILVDGKDQTYLIKSEVATGYVCPSVGDPKREQDWAVYTLAKPVDKRVKPYRIRNELHMSLGPDTPVVAVGKSNDWPPGRPYPIFDDRPRHYGSCKVHKASEYGTSGLVQTDCDSDHGMSGGSLLTPGPDPTLLAIHTGSFDGSAVGGHEGCDAKVGAGGHDEFRADCWGETSVPIAGALSDAIQKAVAGDKWTAPAPGTRVLPKIKM